MSHHLAAFAPFLSAKQIYFDDLSGVNIAPAETTTLLHSSRISQATEGILMF